MTRIRNAVLEDAQRILEIYSYYIEKTAITFECSVPSTAEFRDRMREKMQRYPYIVIEKDERIAGYAYAGPFYPRAAYDWSCELSVYLDKDMTGRGLGRELYTHMEEKLKAMGILNLYACIAVPDEDDEYLTHNSVLFHKHLGFSEAGFFGKCGYKFGRWYNMVWMEKIIGEHGSNQLPILPYAYN
ncbi:MAG: GNAT family N-acetyltransferase [Spirochaetales bacterium]|nr:GNAT family N-acetyltransferase [Spirochaetales bacterium]